MFVEAGQDAVTKVSTSWVRASLDAFSLPMVVSVPVPCPAEQKPPKPWVGSTAVASGSSPASRWAEACWARASSSVSRGSTRSGRPTVPISSDPPVNTAATVPCCSERVRGVVRGVSGGGQRFEDEAGVDGDAVAVVDGCPLEGDAGLGGHEIGGAREASQFQAAGDVVVVDVRLGDVRDPHPAAGRRREHPVDVARRVDATAVRSPPAR